MTILKAPSNKDSKVSIMFPVSPLQCTQRVFLEAAQDDRTNYYFKSIPDERRKYLGAIRFIGELYNAGMLLSNIIYECVEKLLGKIDDYRMEGICTLLNITGDGLENKTNQTSQFCDKGQLQENQKKMDRYFNLLLAMTKSSLLENRKQPLLIHRAKKKDSAFQTTMSQWC